MTYEKLIKMKNTDIKSVNKAELVDIKTVTVNTDLPKEKRIAAFIEQIRNPYCFKYGDFVIKTSFAENGITLEDCLKNILS